MGRTSGSPDWEAGLPEVLQPLLRTWFCGHFSAFGMTPSSSVACEAKLKLLTGEEQMLLSQLLFLVTQDRTFSPMEYVWIKRKAGTLHLSLVHNSQWSL